MVILPVAMVVGCWWRRAYRRGAVRAFHGLLDTIQKLLSRGPPGEGRGASDHGALASVTKRSSG